MICPRCQHFLQTCLEEAQCTDDPDFANRALRLLECVKYSNANDQQKDYDETLYAAIKIIAEKFELVNKIQLPKLNSELAFLKAITERIVKQNEYILDKINKFETGREIAENNYVVPRNGYSRATALRAKTCTCKAARYRTRRRSYVLPSVLYLLNRKWNIPKTSRRK